MRSKKRKTKYVIWLHNHTDSRDDEWTTVWATSALEAGHLAENIDFNRFSIGRILTVKEFRKAHGRNFPL